MSLAPKKLRQLRSALVALAIQGVLVASAEAGGTPNFTWSPSNPVVNQTIQFTDTSTGGPSGWQWDFNNDGTTDSTAQNPTWMFSPAGTYPVKLTVLYPPATFLSVTKNVVVSPAGNPGVLRFSMSSYTVNENVGTASIAVQRINGTTGTVTVNCVTSNGTATAGSDYTATNDLLTWGNGDSSNKNCTVPINNDTTDETNETVNLALNNPTGGATLGTPNTAVLTINDNDDPGDISFTSATYMVDEDVVGGMVSITVRRTGGSSGTVSARCDTSNGTATAGSDYTATTDTLTWTNGDTANKTCTVPIINDTNDEPDETVNLTLTNFTGGAGAGSPINAVLTILDDDEPPPEPAGDLSFTSATYTVAEDVAGGMANITVRRTNGDFGTVTVRCVTSNGTATAGSDYSTTNDLLTWTDGDTANKTCTVPIINDSTEENDETVNLTLTDFTGNAGMGTPINAILTITDDDEAGNISFNSPTYTVDEPAGVANITVRRTGGSDGAVSARCVTSNGTASAPGDYTATNDLLQWPDGDSSNKTCTVPIVNDSAMEGDETVNLTLTSFTGGASPGSPTIATLTIVDDDADPGEISFTMAAYSVDETGTVASIAVRRTGGSDGAVSARCVTSNGTATAGADYTATNDLLSWSDGDSSNKFCTVPITDDHVEEGNETVNLTLNNFMGGAGPGSSINATLTILDDDEGGSLQFSMSSYNVEENVGIANIDVLRVDGSDGNVSVRCNGVNGTAMAPGDFVATSDLLEWADGAIGIRTCTVPIVDDTLEEGQETINLTLTNFSGGASPGSPVSAVLFIAANDDVGELSFSMASYTVGEAVGTASIAVTRTGGSDNEVSVRCDTTDGTANAPGDYTATMDVLTWADGDTADKTCTVPIVDDVNDEPNETVGLALTNFNGANPGTVTAATLTITDNDEAGDLSFTMASYTVNESVGTASVAVQRTGGSDGPVSVRCDTANGTATAPDDYTAQMDLLTWADGDTANKNCTIPIINDVNDELDETVLLSLTNFTGGAGMGTPVNATLTITDNDEAGDLSFTMTGYTVDEEDDLVAMIAVRRTDGSDGPVSVLCNTTNGTATAGSDYTATSDLLQWSHGDATDKICTVPILDDSTQETAETINLSLGGFTGGATAGTPATATLTILESDNPGELSFTMASYSMSESVGIASIAVRRTNGMNGGVSVRCNTADGSATAPDDYAATADVLTWEDGDTADKLCTIPIVDDHEDESNHTVLLSLTNFTDGAGMGTPISATLVILDDDEAGDLSFTMASYSVDESAGTATVAVRRTGGSSGAVSVQCNSANGTATAPGDYGATADVLNWTDGDTANKICTIPIVDDAIEEVDETVGLSLSNPTGGASLTAPANAALTIVDDDDHGDLSFTMASYTVDENAGTASVAVRRTNGSDGIVSVQCNTANGTATAPGDYTATVDVLTWGNGDSANKLCTVPIVNDNVDEPNETIMLSLSNFNGGAGMGSPTSATLTITDEDEAGDLSFSMATYSVDESAGSAMIAVRRTGGSNGAVSVQCNTANGTATAPADYTATMATLSWADGDVADKICTIPIVDDSNDESDETIALSLTSPTGGAVLGTPSSATLTIVDDDAHGSLSFSMATYQVGEADGTASVAVQRTGGSDGTVSVQCNTANGTAVAPGDYTATMAVLTWTNGDSANKICTIPIVDDSVDELDETVMLSLSNFTGSAGMGSQTTATLTILDNDEAGDLSFSMATYSVAESVGTASIAVRRTGGSDGAVSVRCDTADGTATEPDDYTATMDVLNWTNGDTGDKLCTVPIIDDMDSESSETVSLSLSNFTGGATAGSPATASLTILDNDSAGSLSFSMASYEVDEGVGTASIAVQRTGGSSGMVSVQCDTADGTAEEPDDYTATMDVLTWTDGDTADKLCTVPIVDDGDSESAETVMLSLSNFSGGAGMGSLTSATLIIAGSDNSRGELSFSMAAYEVDESVGTANVTVQRTGGASGPVSVRCDSADGTATAGDDYTATMETLSWANGETADKTCTIPIDDDFNTEGDETVLLSLTNVSANGGIGTPSTATLTITDNDDSGILSFVMTSYQVNEAGGTANIAVQRTGGSDGTVSVRCDSADGTATAGSDYTATMDVLSWTDGDTANKNCTVPIADDTIDENNETVNLSLTNVTGGATIGTPNAATLTITDDDDAGDLSFSMAAYSVNEGAGPASITVTRTGGSDGMVSVRCDSANGTATAPADYGAIMDVLTWNDGETASKTCTVTIVDDTNVESNETVGLSLTNFTGGASPGATTSATLTINDNDGAGMLSFVSATYQVDEDAGSASIAVQRTGTADSAVSVQCNTVAGGTATASIDYLTTMQVLSWDPGDSNNKNCSVPILDDAIADVGETVQLMLANPTGGAVLGAQSTATLTIVDDDSPGLISFTMAAYTVNEGTATVNIAVRRTGGSDGTVSARCDTADDTAEAPGDYTVTMDVLTWNDGDTTNKSCTVPIVDDTEDESNEIVDLSLTSLTGGGTLGTPGTATLTINDNDGASALSFSAATYQVAEANGSIGIEVQRSGDMSSTLSVRCNTADGTATAGSDYLTTVQTLTWAPSDLDPQFCWIPILDDTMTELDETVLLTLDNVTGGASLGTANAILTILGNDSPGIFSFTSMTYMVNEGVGTATVAVQRTGGTDGTVTVRCDTANGTAVAPGDYAAQMDTLTWGPGDNANKNCTIPIVDDAATEMDETILLSLAIPTGGATIGMPDSATLTIQDNDEMPGVFSFVTTTLKVNEDVGMASIEVQRTGGAGGTVSVRCDSTGGTATAGSDYTATMDVLNWGPGDATNKTCTVPIVDDSTPEPDETIDLSLTNATGGTVGSPSSATITILANDDPGDLSFSSSTYQVPEGIGIAVIPVRRTGGSSGTVSVRCDTSNGTATAGSDYTATMDVLTWTDGDTGDKICTVPILDDAIVEMNETVNLTLTNFTGGAGQGTPTTAVLTIIEDIFTDGFESGDTSAWDGTTGGLKMEGVRVLPDTDLACGPAQLAPSGSVRLRTSSDDAFVLMLSSEDGKVVVDVDVQVGSGKVIEIYDLPMGSYDLGIAAEDRDEKLWRIDIDLVAPCTAIDLGSEGW